MKSYIQLFLISVLLTYSMSIFAGDNTKYKIGDLYYAVALYHDDYAEVSGITTLKGDVTIQDEVTINGKKYPVESVSEGGFKNAANITSVVFPKKLKRVQEYAFEGCTSLKSVTLPEGLDHLASYAFLNCSGLTQVTLPSTLEALAYQAFRNCNNIKVVRANMKKPSATFDNVFSDAVLKNARLIVPAGTKDLYSKTKGWDLFKHIEEETTGIDAISFDNSTISNSVDSYNLAGQKVSDDYKGIVIKNGKKIIVR